MNIKDEVNLIKDYIVGLRRHFHMYPEVSMEEYQTSKKIKSELDALGISYLPAAGTGVVADIGNGRRIIALRADIDALRITEESDVAFASKNEGVMHACGHDGHTAALLGAARILKQYEHELKVRVRLIWQPGEENCEGARQICAEGHLDDVDEVFGLHIFGDLKAGHISIDGGARMASTDMFEAVFRGKGGHAGKPHQCVDATVVGAAALMNIQTVISRETNPVDSAVVTVGHFESGSQYNIISGKAWFEGTVRTFSASESDRIAGALERVISNTAAAYGAKGELYYKSSRHPVVVNDDYLSEKLREAAVELFGSEMIKPLPKMMLGEDFSFYQQKVPGVFAFVGAGVENEAQRYPNHHPCFLVDEQALLDSAVLHVLYVMTRQEEVGGKQD